MLQGERTYTVEEVQQLGLKCAIYVRMSTDLQAESLENQERQIRSFALHYGIEVVEVYADFGVSGMTAEGREQFLALIADVEAGENTFNLVLYLDESRWGRFVNSRDAEFYRMLLERKNVMCHPCDKPLSLTSTLADRIMTLLRDESASDYCRQLSRKVWIGQCNLVEKGYRQGGVAGYGLRRMLLDEAGHRKQELVIGQRKSLLTERVILIPGPEEEKDNVLWIYDQFIKGMRESEIATHLNQRGVCNQFGRPWSRGTVREVLTNEKYIGTNVFNRTSNKMKSKTKVNPEGEWIRKEGAFEPLVDMERFYTVRGIYRERSKKLTDTELLQGLRELYDRQGRLSALIIDEAGSLPPSSLFRTRFGGLLRAYRMIGYTPERDYQYVAINQRLRALHFEIVADVINRVEALCGRHILVDPESCLMELNYNLFISIVISRCVATSSGGRRWNIRFDTGLRPDITIAVRMNLNNEAIHDYYILPALEFSYDLLKLYERNIGFLDSFRTDSLENMLSLSVNIPLDKAVKDAHRRSQTYPH
ncbi:recombinase family protein [Oleidesulfovibrio sp.]|uniref:recombinase family protein n=1 Tax=Oleidesulfovibrio sp. TaxID=2909707 RepID=UPI003A890E54